MKYINRNYLTALALSSLVLILSACGGDDGGAAAGGGAVINGAAFAGPINGEVCAYAINGAGVVSTSKIACTNTTPATGAYTLNLPIGISGSVLLTVTGTYTDEATNATVTIPATSPIRSFAEVTPGAAVSVAITPLTELAVASALEASGGVTKPAILNAITGLGTIFSLGTTGATGTFNSLFSVIPSTTGTNIQQRTYEGLLAFVSFAQSQGCIGVTTPCTLTTALDKVVGDLDGLAAANALKTFLDGALTDWTTLQAANPYICGLVSGVFTCSSNPSFSGGTGSFKLTITTTVAGTSVPVVIDGVDKPTNQASFCDPASNAQINTALNSRGSFVINSCSFDGSMGTIAATVTTAGVAVPYTVKYEYVAK